MFLTYCRRSMATEVLKRATLRCSWSSLLHAIAARASPLHQLVPSGAVLSVLFFCCAVQNACFRRGGRTEQEVKSWHMPPRSSSCACLFQYCSCGDCTFVWPPSPLFSLHALQSNIKSFFTILRRAARLLFTVTNVAIHGCPHGRVGNERVHKGFLIEWDRQYFSSMHRLGRRCVFVVPSESATLSSLTHS